MGHFSVRVVDDEGEPRRGVGVMIYYHVLHQDKARTDSDGWVQFHNPKNESGHIWVDGQEMGNHSLADGKTYSFCVSS